MRGVYKKSLSYYIILALEKAVDGYVRYDDLIHHSYSYAWGSGWDKPLKKSSLAQALRRLRERGLIKNDIGDTEAIILKLTDSGRDLIIKDASEEWDGKWRIVVFDIPEQKRIIRNLFRRNLKKWGFKRLQKSVWISKKNYYDVLVKYIDELKVSNWVTLIEAERLSSDITTIDDAIVQ
ncbi:CRISPR-associated endonuclease Cas2 [Candidatus Microgenomates bacterium]|nr:CRISPR-associated endonuclease Cas2 [Candidatus Microgenomates bacterium]